MNTKPSFAMAGNGWGVGGTADEALYPGYVALNEGSPGTWSVSTVPEPESYATLLAGLGLLGLMARRR